MISLAQCFKQNARNTFHKKIVYFFWSETYPIVKDSMATKNSTVNIQTDPVALSTMSVKSSEYPKLIFEYIFSVNNCNVHVNDLYPENLLY